MAENSHRHGYGYDVGGDGKERQPGNGSDENLENGMEKGNSRSVSNKDSEDPFGDETNSEVKYRTMAWW
jgi:hypothetical protein